MFESDEEFIHRLKTTPATLDRMPTKEDVRRFNEIEKRASLDRIMKRLK